VLAAAIFGGSSRSQERRGEILARPAPSNQLTKENDMKLWTTKAERAAREAARAEKDLNADVESAFGNDAWIAILDDIRQVSAEGGTFTPEASQLLHDELHKRFGSDFCPEKGPDETKA
jgi:hypothetical protein